MPSVGAWAPLAGPALVRLGLAGLIPSPRGREWSQGESPYRFTHVRVPARTFACERRGGRSPDSLRRKHGTARRWLRGGRRLRAGRGDWLPIRPVSRSDCQWRAACCSGLGWVRGGRCRDRPLAARLWVMLGECASGPRKEGKAHMPDRGLEDSPPSERLAKLIARRAARRAGDAASASEYISLWCKNRQLNGSHTPNGGCVWI